jgi:hypothetical protein
MAFSDVATVTERMNMSAKPAQYTETERAMSVTTIKFPALLAVLALVADGRIPAGLPTCYPPLKA